MYSLYQTVAPAIEPISLNEMKDHLRVTGNDEDLYLNSLIKAARQHLESITGRAFITQTFQMLLDRFPMYEIEVARSPLQSVTSITYTDNDGIVQTWTSAEYRVDTKSFVPRITPEYDYIYPSARYVTNSITITFLAGYGNSAVDVPAPLRHAILLLAAHYYEHREEVTEINKLSAIPVGIDYLIAPYRAKNI